MNMTEKIIAKHAGLPKVQAGEVVEVEVDWCMANDVTIPLTVSLFNDRFRFDRVGIREKVVLINDHRIPADDINTAEAHQIIRNFAKQHDLRLHERDGVCHQVMFESYVKPGELVVAADSHTCSYGSIGAVSVGMGSTDITAVIGSGRTWLKVPECLRIELSGSLKPGVYAKDVILYVIKHLTASGATYMAVEFGGDLVGNLSISERFTLCNMVIEAGGKSSMILPDETTRRHFANRDISWDFFETGMNATYAERRSFDVSHLEPQVACPHHVDNVKDIAEVAGTPIDQAFLGSCTNGRLDDLEIAAAQLRGRKIHPEVRMLVTPASVAVYQAALERGLIGRFMEAGAIVNHPGCSTCWGASQGSLAKGQKMISTANRNFKGRAGSAHSEIYLASPATVALSAVHGKITSPTGEV
ncbi:MAG: 3-isopropylmalate dehydratase large subunit [Magnetococcales bacterium]|nr:3-isopropylmalate dehydratase large subunit [Magnetococcales bacterium]